MLIEVNIEDYIIPLEKLLRKKSKNLDFLDIISIFYNTIIIMSKNNNNLKWIELYKNFLKDLERQNYLGWPDIELLTKEYNENILILIKKPFIKSNNIMTLLLRILYLENHKYKFSFLKNKDKNNNTYIVKNFNLSNIYDLLKSNIYSYINYYYDYKSIENAIAKEILNILEN